VSEPKSKLPDLKRIADRADGWRDEWWLLWVALEGRIRGIVLLGPPNDPTLWSVQPGFRSLLHDPATAEEFISDVLASQLSKAEAGTLLPDALAALALDAVLPQLASTGWLRKRALTFAQRRGTTGVTGMAKDKRAVARLDDGESFTLAQTLVAPEERSAATNLISRLFAGEACLDIAIDSPESLTAIEETGASQTMPKLDPEGGNTTAVRHALEERIDGGIAALESEHSRGQAALTAEHERLVQEGIDHPGMEAQTCHENRRRQTKALARSLFEPLEAQQLQTLFGLPSLNAADKRNSNYRAARGRLFPALFEEFEALEVRG
jgi:hypothetical protein